MDFTRQAKLKQLLILCLVVHISVGCVSKSDNARKFPDRRLSQNSNSQRLVQHVISSLDQLSSPVKENTLIKMNKKPVKTSMKLFNENRKIVLLPLNPKDNKIVFIPQVASDSNEDYKPLTEKEKPTEEYSSTKNDMTTEKIKTMTEEMSLNHVYDKGKVKEESKKDISNVRHGSNLDKFYKKEKKKEETKKWIYRSKIIFPIKASKRDESENKNKKHISVSESSKNRPLNELENTEISDINKNNKTDGTIDMKNNNNKKIILDMPNNNNREIMFDMKKIKNRENIFDIRKINKINSNLTPMKASNFESMMGDIKNNNKESNFEIKMADIKNKESNSENMMTDMENNNKESMLDTKRIDANEVILEPRKLNTKQSILNIKENMVQENLKTLWRTYVKVNRDNKNNIPTGIPIEQEARENLDPINYTKISRDITREMIEEEKEAHPTGTSRRFKRNRDVGVVRGDIEKLFDRFDPFNDNPFEKFEPHSAASSLQSPSIASVARSHTANSLQSPTIAEVARGLSSSSRKSPVGAAARSFSSSSFKSSTALAARGHPSSSSSFQSSLAAAERGRSMFKNQNTFVAIKPTAKPSFSSRGNINRLDLRNSRNSVIKPKDTFFGKIHKDFKIQPSLIIEPVVEKEPQHFGILTEVDLDDTMSPPLRNMIPIPTTSVLKKPPEPTSPTSTLLLGPSGFDNGIFQENDEDNEILVDMDGDSVDKITLEDRSFVVFDAVPDDHTTSPEPETHTSSSVRTKIISSTDADLVDL